MFSSPKHIIDELNLDPGMIVADLGAGSGFYTLSAAELVGNKGRVYAIDVQKGLLAKIKSAGALRHLRNIEVVWGDIEKKGGTHLKDALVDIAIASNIFFQVSDKKTFLEETKRILRPKGQLLIVDWTDSFGGIGPQKEFVVTEAKAKEWAAQAGFAFHRSIRAGEHHYGAVFKKT